MRPHVVFIELRLRDSHIKRWVRIIACTGVGRGKVKFGDPFFRWIRDQILMVEDYAYVGTDFSGDPDLPLPPGWQWGHIGKKQETLKWMNFFYVFWCFILFMLSNETWIFPCRCWSSTTWGSFSIGETSWGPLCTARRWYHRVVRGKPREFDLRNIRCFHRWPPSEVSETYCRSTGSI